MTRDDEAVKLLAEALDEAQGWGGYDNHLSPQELSETATALLDRLRPLLVPEWQPIATAPKDGAEYLAYWPTPWETQEAWNIERTWFEKGRFVTPTSSEEPDTPYSPTHWKPLDRPAPPAEGG